MPKKRKQYNREFKIEAVKLTEDPERSVASVASSLGVSTSLFIHGKRSIPSTGFSPSQVMESLSRLMTSFAKSRKILHEYGKNETC